ncbi:hypothetical protein SAMN03159339_4163 [Variovorax sp. 770b2]|nr:hypothetical protein SAMN03159339_4163 [Variovorax sp. 770b2]
MEKKLPANLPYLASPNSIKTALEKIRNAATPDRVTGDFVNTVLQMKGGTGAQISPFLKKIGFVASDGAPTELYKRFRNPAAGGAAIAEAIRIGYKDLAQSNEYFYMLDDKGLLALIVQVTGAEANGAVPKLIQSTLKALKLYADFNSKEAAMEVPQMARKLESEDDATWAPATKQSRAESENLGLNLSYTINLNLPATSDQAVFNAIFRSLKEHLLSNNG